MSTIYMGTTKIAPERTAGEIQMLLARSGAQQIACEYKAGRITAMRFVLSANGQQFAFCLPVRIEPLVPKLKGDKLQAERTAWRQVLRWVEAQLALIDVGMVQAAEVYAPYMMTPDGSTLAAKILAPGGGRLLLSAADPPLAPEASR